MLAQKLDSESSEQEAGLPPPDTLLRHRADPTLEDTTWGETARERAERSSARGHPPPRTG